MTKSKPIIGIWKKHYRMVIFIALCLTIMVCPAFAVTLDESASNTLSDMFGKLDEAYTVIKGICIVAAAATIASLGYAFFCYSGSDSDKKISTAKSRAIHVIAACGVLFLLPTIMSNAKATLKASNMAWDPSGGSGNHIIEPKAVPEYTESGESGSTAEKSEDNSNESSNTNGSNSTGGSKNNGGSGNKTNTTYDNNIDNNKKQEMIDDNAGFYNTWNKGHWPDDQGLWESYLSYCERHGVRPPPQQ